MTCSYWNPSHDTVFVDCVASWVEERWRNPVFTPLRLEPWRVQVMRGEEYPAGELTGAVWYGH
ncbi:MAG TPA: hypothetical protein VG126_07420 [Thermoleophilaceae bacterium]|nr:hypothetical protein [Thermoleophilaceae bacterium]